MVVYSYFGLSLDHLQANIHRQMEQSVSSMYIGTPTTYKVYVRAIKDIKIFVKMGFSVSKDNM